MLILELIAVSLFILGFRNFAALRSARIGNIFAIVATTICFVNLLVEYLTFPNFISKFIWTIGTLAVGGSVGVVITNKLKMQNLPQLIAAFHSLVGLSALILDICFFYFPESFGITEIFGLASFEICLGSIVGIITFSGSIIAFLKLQGVLKNNIFSDNILRYLNIGLYWGITFASFLFLLESQEVLLWIIIILSLIFGLSFTLAIKGADMPVVVSLLNALSGCAALSIGFTFENSLLIVIGALVAASGTFLSWSMCKAMNRTIGSVLLAGMRRNIHSNETNISANLQAKMVDLSDASYLLENAESVVIVPGYGMAVAQAQHALKTLLDKLEAKGTKVKFAVHPVAGRMPGHMNVLLAEANIPDDYVVELEEVNSEMPSVDVALIVGANDIVNPSAASDTSSPLYGMPVLEVWMARTVIVIKRSMKPGYSGVDNSLFFKENTFMLLGDAKRTLEKLGL